MRGLVRSEVLVDAPAAVVWDYVTDWPRQGEWIPLTRVELVAPAPSGSTVDVGARCRAWTGVGPLGFWDPFTITAVERHDDGSARCDVLHHGRVVRGDGTFEVTPWGSGRSRFAWSDRVEVPAGAVGGLAWRLGGGWLSRRGFDVALRRLARRAAAVARDQA